MKHGENSMWFVKDISGDTHCVLASEVERVHRLLKHPVCFQDLNAGDRFTVKALPEEGVWGKCPTYKQRALFGMRDQTLAVQVDPPTYKLLEVWEGVEVLPCP